MIRIKSKREGFRRCGMAFTEKPMFFADDHFSEAELEVLRKEPNLKVDVGDFDEEPTPVPDGVDINLADALAVIEDLEKRLGAALSRIQELEDELAKAGKPADPEKELVAAAKMAIDNGDVTGGGKPEVKAMEEILGRSVSAGDRDRAYEQLTAGGN